MINFAENNLPKTVKKQNNPQKGRLRKSILLTALSALMSQGACAIPTIRTVFSAASNAGETGDTLTTFEGSAPITARFRFEILNQEDYESDFEWRFCHEGGTLEEPYMIRYEEEPEVVFTQAGTDSIALYITFTRGEEKVEYRRYYWNQYDGATALTIKASESVLTFPNAFSPNGDQRNDTYGPKEYRSIVEFKAIIFSRTGQKLYEWTDVSSPGWDGTYHGKKVRDGVYFVYVRAKGADGRTFTIKKDVNVLTSFDSTYSSSSSSSEGTAE